MNYVHFASLMLAFLTVKQIV